MNARRRPAPTALMRLATVAWLLAGASHCADRYTNPAFEGQDTRLTFLHTSDIHARLLPYRQHVIMTDRDLGMKQDNEPFGGVARMAYIINRERARSARTIYVDTGDYFQGAPIFNAFNGEAEMRAVNYLRPDAVAVGNHEFDSGLYNYATQLARNATFPSLAANYLFEEDNPLKGLVEPYTIINVDGIRVGIIGVGDFSSLSSITDIGNSLKIVPLNIEQAVQDYIDFLRPQVDLIVVASHAGLSRDESMIRCTTGIDVLFGGHLHIVLMPPKVVVDAGGRSVPIVHSGAFAKYVGRLDAVLRRPPADYCCQADAVGCRRKEYEAGGQFFDCVGLEVADHKYTLYPVDSTTPDDPKMLELMEEYRLRLNQMIDLTGVYAYTANILTKYGYGGGSSSLGNLVAETLREYARVDVGFTNTLGIRSNMDAGPVTQDDLYNIFPFNNTITLMYMSGKDLEALMDYNVRRSAGRGCVSQLQVSGIQVTMNCTVPPEECRCRAESEVCPGTIGLEYDRPVECSSRFDLDLADVMSDGRTRGEHCLAPANCERTGTCGNLCVCPEGATSISQCRCPPMAQDIYVTDCSNPTAGIQTLCVNLAEKLGEAHRDDLMLTDDETGCTCTRIDHPAGRDLVFQVATNDYIANGGSGFTILRSNNTQEDTGLPLREAVLEKLIRSPECIEQCRGDDGQISLGNCFTYKACEADLTAYHSTYCDHLAETSFGEVDMLDPEQCAVDPSDCLADADCYDTAAECVGNTCRACRYPIDCLMLNTAEQTYGCFNGVCLPDRFHCVVGRCRRACQTRSDCPGGADIPEAQQVCANGGCLPSQDGSCLNAADCSPGLQLCYGGAPACSTDSDCLVFGADLVCNSRLCIPARARCTKDTNCAADEVCRFGWCAPDGISCTADTDCGADAACVRGVCNQVCGPCVADADCPTGQLCSQGYCIVPTVQCVDHQCRGSCQQDDECPSGAQCVQGHCLPSVCLTPTDRETVCLMEATWRAREECLRLSCPQALEDGRIRRILPENLSDLPSDQPPNDPEDIDENLGGGGEGM